MVRNVKDILFKGLRNVGKISKKSLVFYYLGAIESVEKLGQIGGKVRS